MLRQAASSGVLSRVEGAVKIVALWVLLSLLGPSSCQGNRLNGSATGPPFYMTKAWIIVPSRTRHHAIERVSQKTSRAMSWNYWRKPHIRKLS